MNATKAVFYKSAHTVVTGLQDPTPPPGAGEVQLQVAYNGICGTDLHIFHGHMDERVGPPAVIGHEMSATIAAVGPEVTDWQIGDPVSVMPLDWCGTCPACDAGHRHICHNLNFIGIDSPGALQERWTVKSEHLVALPKGTDLSIGALAEPLAVAVHDVRRGEVAAGDDVVVIGGGPIGVLIGLVANELGANVLISEPDAGRRKLAEEIGLSTLDPTAAEIGATIHELTADKGADVAFEVSGTAAGAAALTTVLKTRGLGVVVGIHTEAPPIDLFQVFWRELTIRGARVYEREDFEHAVVLLTSGRLPVNKLITEIVPADEAQQAFQRLEKGGAVLKVLIDCQAFDGVAH